MHGILNINKPAGVTSRDIVNRVQRRVRPHKVGHAGTLDPLATGVLVVCVGAATRLVEYVQRMPKRYTATFVLGCQSDTEDTEGEVRTLAAARTLSREDILKALPNFIGTISQRPPAYSAIKVGGQRAYKLARAGKEVDVAPRDIKIYALELREFDYPQMVLEIACGSGTYVRSLGRDIAQSLGSGAVMQQLVRTAIGDFRVEQSLSANALDDIASQLLPIERAVAALPQITVDAEEAQHLANGRFITRTNLSDVNELAAIDADGRLIAIVAPRGEGQLRPVKGFAATR